MKLWIVFLILALVTIASGTVYIDHELEKKIDVDADGMLFIIARGSSLNGVMSALAERRVLKTNSVVARLYAWSSRNRGTVKAGEYRLMPDMSLRDVLGLFRSGRVVQRQITFVEGWVFDRWRAHLEQEGAVDQTLTGETDADIMKLLGEGDLHPEGQFFPDTYHFAAGESDLNILRRAHGRMKEVLNAEWQSRNVGTMLRSRYQALILASIVEKETGYEPDRPKIARVFMNRLQRNIRLQSDPTVIYGLGDAFDGDLTRRDLRFDSPYNTYRYRGLPPTPISNPGLASVRAVMRPEPGNWLYFVGRGDGKSHFSSTLDEHNEAVTRFQKTGRVDNYKSVPGEIDE